MYGREKLGCFIAKEETYCFQYDDVVVYDKEEADKVIDAMEAQIRNLTNANAELIKRVQSLEDECNKLEVVHATEEK